VQAFIRTTPEIDDAVLAKLDALLAEPEVIACGEIGLDYYHEEQTTQSSAQHSFANWRLPPTASDRF